MSKVIENIELNNIRKNNIINALKEVELIRTGKLQRKSARDFLAESRKEK